MAVPLKLRRDGHDVEQLTHERRHKAVGQPPEFDDHGVRVRQDLHGRGVYCHLKMTQWIHSGTP